jgi:hypothetical protein
MMCLRPHLGLYPFEYTGVRFQLRSLNATSVPALFHGEAYGVVVPDISLNTPERRFRKLRELTARMEAILPTLGEEDFKEKYQMLAAPFDSMLTNEHSSKCLM